MPNELMKTLTIGANTYDLPQKTSDLTNDSGFITTETDPTVPSWAKASSKPSYTASEVGAAASSHTHGNITNSGDITANATIANGDRLVINDESASKITNSSITFGSSTTQYLANNGTWQNVPTVPTKTSDLTNDSGFITSTTANDTYVAKTGDTITGNVIIGRFTGGAVHSPSLRFSSDYGDYLSLGASEDYSYIASYYLQLQANVEMKSGKTFTLASDPTANLQAATKQYVDNAITTAIGAAIGGSY